MASFSIQPGRWSQRWHGTHARHLPVWMNNKGVCMLHYCSTCREKSIQTKVYMRKRDKAKCLFERCINKNPDCQYKHHRVLSQGGDLCH